MGLEREGDKRITGKGKNTAGKSEKMLKKKQRKRDNERPKLKHLSWFLPKSRELM